MKTVRGYLLDRATGAAISGKTVNFRDLAGAAISTLNTYYQSVDAVTQADGSFTGNFELSPGPVNISVTVSGSEVKARKWNENAQFGITWSSDLTRVIRGIPEGVLPGFFNELALSVPSGHTIRIATGGAVFNGGFFSFENNYYEVAGTANPAGPANPRIDLITLRQYNADAVGQLAGKQEVIVTLGTVSGVAPVTPTGSNFKDFPIGTVSTAVGSPTKTVNSDLRVFAGGTAPVGTVTAYAGAVAPVGWLLCDGTAVGRSAYAGLFGVVGSTYGAGDGSTTFNLPNLKGRAPFGRDAAQLVFDTLGEAGGEVEHLLTAAESGIRNHSHVQWYHTHAAVSKDNGGSTTGNLATSTLSASTAGSGDFNAVNSHQNMPPYVVMNYIIKA